MIRTAAFLAALAPAAAITHIGLQKREFSFQEQIEVVALQLKLVTCWLSVTSSESS